MMVISLAVDSHQNRTMAVFLTVALSVLQAQQQIATSNNSSAKTAEWSFSRYPPSVEFLEMNKQTLFAKQCAQTEQLYSNVSYQEKATITTALMMPSQEINTQPILSRTKQQEATTETPTCTKSERWYRQMLAYLARKIDRPRSIYSKTVKGMTRKDLQLDQHETTLYQKLLGDGQQSSSL